MTDSRFFCIANVVVSSVKVRYCDKNSEKVISSEFVACLYCS